MIFFWLAGLRRYVRQRNWRSSTLCEARCQEDWSCQWIAATCATKPAQSRQSWNHQTKVLDNKIFPPNQSSSTAQTLEILITKIRRKQCSPNKNIQEILSALALLTSFYVFLCPFQTGVESSTLISLFSLLDSDLRIYVQPLPVSLCLRGDSTMKLWSWLIDLRWIICHYCSSYRLADDEFDQQCIMLIVTFSTNFFAYWVQ